MSCFAVIAVRFASVDNSTQSAQLAFISEVKLDSINNQYQFLSKNIWYNCKLNTSSLEKQVTRKFWWINLVDKSIREMRSYKHFIHPIQTMATNRSTDQSIKLINHYLNNHQTKLHSTPCWLCHFHPIFVCFSRFPSGALFPSYFILMFTELLTARCTETNKTNCSNKQGNTCKYTNHDTSDRATT